VIQLTFGVSYHPRHVGRLCHVIRWSIHRRQVIKDFLASGAAQRLHLECLPAYAPELNPGEGLWQQLKGVELRNRVHHDLGYTVPFTKGGTAQAPVPRSSHPYVRGIGFDELDGG